MDRVLEIGGYAAGFCGRLFVQAGCEVVRVERNCSGGPEARAPAWVRDEAMDLFLHPGKRRVAIDSVELIEQLASTADVVILEGDSADSIADYRFDAWQTPVKVAITPFGRTGPKRNWRATPNVLLAMGGYTNIMGDPGRAPLSLPGHYLEFQTGQFAYTAANACRLARESNDVDISLLECLMALSQFTTVMWHCAGRERTRHGNDFWWVVPTNLFPCRDGWVYINIIPTFWDALATFLDRPEILKDERFTTNDLRKANREAMHEIVEQSLAPWSKKEVEARATAARIPATVVQTLDEVLADAHLAERDFWQIVEGGSQAVHVPSLPFRFDNEPRPSFSLSRAQSANEVRDG